MAFYSEQLFNFYNQLERPSTPKGIDVLFPFDDPGVKNILSKFYSKYYNDTQPRRLILGINPGRFGAGTTGINFTAPRQLKNKLGIDHELKDQSELSAEFIYEMIELMGGPENFYRKFFIGAISPLGFTRKGINLNYYDDKKLQKALTPFIIQCMESLLAMGFSSSICFCIGGDKNYKFLCSLNEKHKFFDEILPLAHPRFIMQYKRKEKQKFLNEYVSILSRV